MNCKEVYRGAQEPPSRCSMGQNQPVVYFKDCPPPPKFQSKVSRGQNPDLHSWPLALGWCQPLPQNVCWPISTMGAGDP